MKKRLQNKWSYGQHFFPPDIKQKEWLSEKGRIDTLIGLGIEPTICHRAQDPGWHQRGAPDARSISDRSGAVRSWPGGVT